MEDSERELHGDSSSEDLESVVDLDDDAEMMSKKMEARSKEERIKPELGDLKRKFGVMGKRQVVKKRNVNKTV